MVRWFRLPFLFLVTCIASTFAHAQSLPPPTIDSIDANVLNATTIAVGTVTESTKDSKTGAKTATVKVSETLRGEARSEIGGRIWDLWDERRMPPPVSAKVIVFLSADERIRLIDISNPNTKASTADFKFLRSPTAILAYVRDLLEKHPTVTNIGRYTMLPPETQTGRAWTKEVGVDGLGGLVVPADERLEKLAFAFMRSKDYSRASRASGALKLFKSERNIAKMKELLTDPHYRVTVAAERWKGIEIRDYRVRNIAIEVLKTWNVPFEEPVTPNQVSKRDTIKSVYIVPDYQEDMGWLLQARQLRKLIIPYGFIEEPQLQVIGQLTELTDLELTRVKMGDTRFKLLTGLKNLRTLKLDNNPITDESLNVLSQFSKLREVSLFGTQVSEAGVAALKKALPGLKVNTTKGEKW